MNALQEMLTVKGLTQREAQVTDFVTRGLSNREIATELFVTEKTVKFHLTNIYKKLNVKSRAQLIIMCLPHLTFSSVIETNEENISKVD